MPENDRVNLEEGSPSVTCLSETKRNWFRLTKHPVSRTLDMERILGFSSIGLHGDHRRIVPIDTNGEVMIDLPGFEHANVKGTDKAPNGQSWTAVYEGGVVGDDLNTRDVSDSYPALFG